MARRKSRSLVKASSQRRVARANPVGMNTKHVALFSFGAAVGALLMHLHMKQ